MRSSWSFYIIVLAGIGCCIVGGIYFMRRRKARAGAPPKLFVSPMTQAVQQKPLPADQVPMLGGQQNPFSDAAAVSPGPAPPYGGYPQNGGGYASSATAENNNTLYPPTASQSNVSLGAYQQASHMNAVSRSPQARK